MEGVRWEAGRDTLGGGAICSFFTGAHTLNPVFFDPVGAQAGKDCVRSSNQATTILINSAGQAVANQQYAKCDSGGYFFMVSTSNTTGTGGTPGNDVNVDGKIIGIAQAVALSNVRSGALMCKQFLNMAAASAVLGVIDGAGPVWIQKVRKPTEGLGLGSGMLCNYSAAGPGGAGFYTADGLLATE